MSEQMKKEIRDVLAKWANAQEILLRAGEMTKGELMTAKAVVTGLSADIERVMRKSSTKKKVAAQS